MLEKKTTQKAQGHHKQSKPNNPAATIHLMVGGGGEGGITQQIDLEVANSDVNTSPAS